MDSIETETGGVNRVRCEAGEQRMAGSGEWVSPPEPSSAVGAPLPLPSSLAPAGSTCEAPLLEEPGAGETAMSSVGGAAGGAASVLVASAREAIVVRVRGTRGGCCDGGCRPWSSRRRGSFVASGVDSRRIFESELET